MKTDFETISLLYLCMNVSLLYLGMNVSLLYLGMNVFVLLFYISINKINISFRSHKKILCNRLEVEIVLLQKNFTIKS
jgi:hypothetical protein